MKKSLLIVICLIVGCCVFASCQKGDGLSSVDYGALLGSSSENSAESSSVATGGNESGSSADEEAGWTGFY